MSRALTRHLTNQGKARPAMFAAAGEVAEPLQAEGLPRTEALGRPPEGTGY